MLNDLLIFAFSLWGIIALLFTIIFKMLLWKTESFTFSIPLTDCDKEIYNKIYNVRSFCEFCGIQKRSTIVIISYDAPEWFCKEIADYYDKYDFIKIVSSTDQLKELHT